MTEEPKTNRKQTTTNVDAEVLDDLRAYAFGTMQTLSDVIREAIDEYYQEHYDDIQRQKVVR